MGRDKGYGSGKPLSANDSRTRTRIAAGRFTKGKKRAVDNLVSRSVEQPLVRDKYNPKTARGAADVFEFATGVRVGRKGIKSVDPLGAMAFLPLGKATRVAQTLLNANKGTKAAALMARSATAEAGRAASRQWAATRAMKGSGKKFQASAAKSWHMRFLGENLKAAAKAVPKKASLAVPPTIGKKLANANRANTVIRGAESAFNNALRAGKGKSFGVLENIETAASRLQGLRSRGVPKRGR
jgi:hypothetical protein